MPLSANRPNLDVFVYVKEVLDRLLAGDADYHALRPDVWKQAHPEAVWIYGAEGGSPAPTPRPRSGPGDAPSRVAERAATADVGPA